MEHLLSRRQLLAALPLGLLFGLRRAQALEDGRSAFGYQLDLTVLFSFLTLSLSGTAVQEIDRRAGKYRVTMDGQGTGISTRTEATGIIRNGRFKPVETKASIHFRNRENTLHHQLRLHPPAGRYSTRSPTPFCSGGGARSTTCWHPRGPPRGRPDLGRAQLRRRHARAGPDGTYQTYGRAPRPARQRRAGRCLARRLPRRAGTAALPGRARRGHRPADARSSTSRGFSSWARAGQPARVTFAPDRHLESRPVLADARHHLHAAASRRTS